MHVAAVGEMQRFIIWKHSLSDNLGRRNRKSEGFCDILGHLHGRFVRLFDKRETCTRLLGKDFQIEVLYVLEGLETTEKRDVVDKVFLVSDHLTEVST